MNLNQFLSDARSGLVDLSLSNPLLNYKFSKKRGISLSTKDIVSVANKLIGSNSDQLILSNEFSIDLEDAEIISRVKFTASEAKLFIEERGVNVLFLAIGFISWVEDDRSESTNVSPLLMVPVKLEIGSNDEVNVMRIDDDVQENFALIEKLKGYGLDIPRYNEDKKIESYLDEFQALNNHPMIKEVSMEKVVIDIFKTQKYFMYEDLNPDLWKSELDAGESLPAFIHKLINQDLFEYSVDEITEDFIDGLDVDADPLLVKDADLSQFKTILFARTGKSFVIQGPPGTGKSQTITNLIADLVANRKRVLFVSEKSTALDVVRNNLSDVGLGGLVLDLHDPDSRKTGVLKDISSTIEISKNFKSENKFSQEEYYKLKKDLSLVRDSLKSTINQTDYRLESVVSNLSDLYEQFIAKKISFSLLDSYISSDVFSDVDRRGYLQSLEALRSYESGRQNFSNDNINFFIKFPFGNLEHIDVIRVESLISEVRKELDTCQGDVVSHDVSDVALVKEIEFINGDFEELINCLEVNLPLDYQKEISDLIDQLYSLRMSISSYQGLIKKDGWLTEVSVIRSELSAVKKGIVKQIFSLKNEAFDGVKNIYFNKTVKGERVDELLRVIDAYQSKINAYINQFHTTLFVSAFNQGDFKKYDISYLIDFLENLRKKIIFLEKHSLTDVYKRSSRQDIEISRSYLISKSNSNSSDVDTSALIELAKLLDMPNLISLSKADLLVFINGLPDALKIKNEWATCQKLLKVIQEKKLMWAIEQAVCLPSEAYSYVFFKRLKNNFDSSKDQNVDLDGVAVEAMRAKFSQLDAQRKLYAKDQILERQSQSVASLLVNPTANFAKLNLLFKKSRNIPSIRNVLKNCFDEIISIKPILMMSPLSVASFIPRKLGFFDYVIFDEASQVKPSDALGAILRARHTIIVGDSMQLPPTRIFDVEVGDSESNAHLYDAFDVDSDQTGIKDIPSILDYAGTLRMPEYRLNWHYRSKFQNLIAVSNKEFYSNELVTFPDARVPIDGDGLTFTYVEDGNYDRASTRKNINEADKVVQAVLEHFRLFPTRSLGVATFSVAQKEAIEERIYRTQENRNLIDAFNRNHDKEKFFIKNLERIQGDERDSIFISVGYGKSPTSDVINFGPLSQNGGDKRLNVLISRAKYSCRVFSSIKHYDIATTNNTYPGVGKLKTFLKYADTGEIDVPVITGGDYDSDFERSVANAIRNMGYSVDCQVGSSGFKVDLAVRHPARVGEYLCGVECDGATYHSSLTARERDRIRQEILESRGWKILRIWSTDWFRNKEREIQKIKRDLEKLIGTNYDF